MEKILDKKLKKFVSNPTLKTDVFDQFHLTLSKECQDRLEIDVDWIGLRETDNGVWILYGGENPRALFIPWEHVLGIELY